MQTESNRIQVLFKKYLEHSITKEEYSEFWNLLRQHDINELSPQLQALWLQSEGAASALSDEEWNRRLKALIQKAEAEDASEDRNGRNGSAKNATREERAQVRNLRLPFWKWAVAASIILLIGITTFLAITARRGNPSPVAVHANDNHDVAAPTNTRAVITLANGTKVYLDSAGNGTIAQENNVNVVKNSDGSVVYSHEGAKAQSEIEYNTLSNPRGSKVISLTLSDGTKVWLNSESSLRCPTAFTSATREVEITGEAYFEVKHNSKQPFKVHLPGGGVVEDIGTSFNVNSYGDESDLKTTLIEGSVKLSSSRPGVLAVKIKPGEQAIINQVNPKVTRIEVQTNVNVDEVTAWKNGQFSFSGADIKTVMRELARWYDVDVEYKDQINETFFVKMDRNTNVSNVFKILQTTGGVHFKIEGKKITVYK